MKNLSAIPRLSLSEAFTILIMLVVCLAGFTKAEVQSNYNKQDPNHQVDDNFLLKEASFKKNVPYTQKKAKIKGDELQQKNFANIKNFPESSLDKLINRHPDYFGESDESDSEKESDGYGYDDDEYYHFNYKRNDEVTGNLQNNKLDKEALNDANPKDKFNTQKFAKTHKETDKELKTIEMLNFKETHPVIANDESQNLMQNPKPFSNDVARKKTSSSDPLGSLKIVDLKENSAIDESMKDRKEESGGVLASGSSDQKIAEAKKGVKTTDEKDSSKLKDSKLGDETEKKEKEATLKDGKEAVAAKNLKDNSKSSEEKEKGVKLSDSAKLEENLEKINIKNKDSDAAKITKEDKDISRFSDKVNSDVINPNEISQINNRASFVSNDYKDNLDAVKAAGGQGDEKNSEEMNENEKNVGLNDYLEDIRQGQEKLKEKQYNLRKSEGSENYEYLNGQYNTAPAIQEDEKSASYLSVPVNFEVQNSNPSDFYNKRESWKESGRMFGKVQQQQPQQQQQQEQQQLTQEQQSNQQQQLSQDQILQRQQQMELSFEPKMKNSYPANNENNELENTEYHKNYLKSLKRYKVLSDSTKILNPESSSFSSVEKSSFRDKPETKKKKRSKTKKRRSMTLTEKVREKKEKIQNEHLNFRRNTLKAADRLSSQPQKCMLEHQDPQSLSNIKTAKEDTTLLESKKCERLESSRERRKSPQKLEYEIKVINQNRQDPKNAQLSHFSSKRSKKDVKTKLATEDKYLKKYPYSQVSRDDLTRLNTITELESEKKFKRKAPIWKRHDQKSVIQTRAVPTGYYSNRVKFGQKSYARNNEKTGVDTSPVEMNRMPSQYLSQVPSAADKKNLQRAWEIKQQNYRHDPIKRYDENAYLNKGNSLLLVKKGERTAKTFDANEDSSKTAGDDDLDTEQLAKILSKDNDYVVLKRTENNRFRKVSEGDPSLSFSEPAGASSTNKKSGFEEEPSDLNLFRTNGRQISYKNKGLRTRSSRPEKEDRKYSATFHSSNSKSNLKKTFDKFRDLADFFKDNEQESAENQYPIREVKEGRDIVFSEDKLPDPIVISSDESGKTESLKQKPQNSIYSISTNFKNLDQQDRKNDMPNTEANKNMFTSEMKSDAPEFSWEPALKTAFPEAKSINAMNKNGNEIIVLDFNRNQLKSEHSFNAPSKTPSKMQSYSSLGSSRFPLNRYINNRKIQLILNEIPPIFQPPQSLASNKNEHQDKKAPLSNQQSAAYAVIRNEENQPQVSIPLHELADLPNLLKTLIEKKTNELNSNLKSVSKKSSDHSQESKVSENYSQFLKDLSELSDINKSGFSRKGKLSGKRNLNEIILPSSSFSELSTYSDANIRHLGNILQNIMTKDSPVSFGFKEPALESANREISKSSDEYQKSNQLYQNAAGYESDATVKRQGRWSSAGEKDKDYTPFIENDDENIPDEVREEINNLLGGEGLSHADEKGDLWEELAAASDKIHRMRREGMGKRNLRKTIEDALSSRQRRESFLSPYSKMDDKSKKLSNSVTLSSKAKASKNLNLEPQLKKDEETKESSEGEKSQDSDIESHLSEFFENLGVNKNQKVPNESTWNRKKRKDNHRRKRFSRRDVKNKVSKTEVQNTILKNLAEDNYQSIYSPGIKRRLLSTKNEAEDAESYSDADEHDKNVIAEEAQAKCVKNAMNKCMDPVIVELFGDDDSEEKNRARRSLTSSFHSNFKREIDLDESMPNDFQNFLVTSLGGFGSQKREVVKKDEALWEGKETSQDSYNQIAESSPGGKDASEDSALEKREVSPSKNQKNENFKNSDYFMRESDSDSNMVDMGSLNEADKKVRCDDKSKVKSKTSEFVDEKLPTQIRIQITNASSKEKKSSKPIMDESETTSTEMENLPKEKEFFDKNKINPLLANSLPKLHQLPKNKLSFNEYEENENRDLGVRQKPYRPYRRRKRKRKKYVPENPMKPVKDFIAFDQKAMETLLKKCKPNQNMLPEQITQRSPVSNHLPQVETVYNPTQGTNKAQLETPRLGKINSINSKNSVNVKNSLQTNEASAYDEGIIRSYLKAEKMKSDKGAPKEFEDVEWKPSSSRMRLGQESARDPQYGLNSQGLKIQNTDSTSLLNNNDMSHYLSLYNQNYPRWFQSPYSNYFYHAPYPSLMNSHSLYDAIKLKQELKNRNAMNKDHAATKAFTKPYYFNENNLLKQEEKDKNQNPVPSYLNSDGTLNSLDFSLNKKPYVQVYKTKDYYNLALKNQNQAEPRYKVPYGSGRKFIKNVDEDKSLPMDVSPSVTTDNTKDPDYLDTLEDEYSDEDGGGKEPQTDEPVMRDSLKKGSKLHETPSYHRLYNYKNSDVDDSMNEDDEEFDEDYDESSEDDDLDEYSLLANTKALDPEISRNSHGGGKFQGAYRSDDVASHFNYFYPQLKGNSFEQTKFNSNPDEKFGQGIPVSDIKNDVDPVTGSTSLLKKANENSNIFGKNLLKNLNGYSYHDTWSRPDKLQDDKTIEDLYPIFGNKLNKRKLDRQVKLKRSQDYPKIGSRLFFAAKTEVSDDKDIYPSMNTYRARKSRNSRHSHYRLPFGNSLEAGFASPENDFDHDSEEEGKYFTENLPSLKKIWAPEDEGKCSRISQKDTRDVEYPEDVEDIKRNLEDDGEAISDDNILENVIGKYIMRKGVKSLADPNKASGNSVEEETNDKDLSDDVSKHNLRKRSTERQLYAEKLQRVLKKRLSSGHLTENNFRKYHKKNLNAKRHANELGDSPYATATTEDDETNARIYRKNGDQTKRSAFNLFRKITNKDRDSKKAENADRSAGFEPLLSLGDNTYMNSAKDVKEDSLLLRENKLQNDVPQAETKLKLPELKAHYPNEGQRLKVQLTESKKKEKTKEAVKERLAPLAQGPWKIQLNDKYDYFNLAERPDKESRKSFKSLKELEEVPFKDTNDDNLKAFLVISKNVRADEGKSAEALLPASGSFLREVGNSYRPKIDEGRRISKKHVRKRCLESSVNRMKTNYEDAAQTPTDHIVKESIPESHVNKPEMNRALHDTKSLSEGDSKPEAPHVLQRNTKSFVTTDEQCHNSQFLSKGRSINRKSVFPPSSDANITRDSRHINEETSEYLGQQIVDAILSHASTNPKFKDLIAPGLAMRTSAYKEGIDFERKALNQMDFSEQLQSFLQKFMFDLEKLAEKHVKKRMCHKIDKESKHFLESLLSVPAGSVKGKTFDPNEKMYPSPTACPEDESDQDPTVPSFMDTLQNNQEQYKLKQNVLKNLRKKQCLLLKLIDDYQNLSKVEKEALNVNYQYLIQELDQTNQEIGSPYSHPCLVPVNDFCAKKKAQNRTDNDVVKADGNGKVNKYSPKCPTTEKSHNENSTSAPSCETPPTNEKSKPAPKESCSTTTAKPDTTTKKNLPILYFSEEENPRTRTIPKTTPPSPFEKVSPTNLTHLEQKCDGKDEKQNATKPERKPSEIPGLHLPPTPQRFNLLPLESSTTQRTNKKISPEKFRVKQSLPQDDDFYENYDEKKDVNFNYDDFQYQPYSRPTELHKLSLGDAAGLQLSLKYRGPWVSNLDVAKTFRSAPIMSDKSNRNAPLPKAEVDENQSMQKFDYPRNAPFAGNFKNSRSFIASNNEYSSFDNQKITKDNPGYFYTKPIFPYDVDKKFFTPKKRPFQSISQSKWPAKNCQMFPLQYLFRKCPPPEKKQVLIRSDVLSQSYSRRKQLLKNFGRKKKRVPPHFPVRGSSKLKRKPKIRDKHLKYLDNSVKDNSDESDQEYLEWSSMPAVRRELNNLGTGFEFKIPLNNPTKKKKLWGKEKKA